MCDMCREEVNRKDFFFNDTATTEIYTLSLHDALPICTRGNRFGRMTGRTGFDDNRRTNTDDATVAGDFNSEFGRQTAAAAREGRDNFGRDTADEARTRRSEVTRGSSSERATRSRSRRTFGESIRNGFRRIGTALRLPGLNRRASR